MKKYGQDLIRRLEEIPVGRTNLWDVLAKTLLVLLIITSGLVFFTSEKPYQNMDLKIGSIAPRKVVAPFNFYILKTPEELDKERKLNTQKVPFYFTYDDSVTREQESRLKRILPFLINARKEFRHARYDSVRSDSVLLDIKRALLDEFQIQFTEANLRVLFDILKDAKNIASLDKAVEISRQYIKNGILSLRLSEISRPNVVVIRNGIEEVLNTDERVDLPTVQNAIENILLQRFNVNQTIVLNYLFSQLIQPNFIFNEQFTKQKVDEAVASISRTKDIVYENERIVDANQRIDKDIYQKLYSLKMARLERSQQEGEWTTGINLLARIMLLLAILFVAGLYLFSFRKNIFRDNKQLFMITLIILAEMVTAAVFYNWLNWHAFLIPTTVVAMLLAILVDSGIAFLGIIIVALILAGLQGTGFDFVLLTVISGLVGIYSVHSIRNRNQVFKAIIYIALAYLWTYLALTALRYESFFEALKMYTYFLLPNSVFSPLLTFILLGLFERAFDITTDVTLLELSDMNHPLLKRLSMEAPGTFHHSMVVGNLAEAAAKAIGANPLLARVGSYYHDIGKMEKPEYFVENQMDAENRHNQLSPNMSALILASHVKVGMEMAEKYNIPRRVRDFIPEHHGTNIMKYFYNKALEGAGDNEVNEADFRYPGPKPRSKETAIVMLADAVEAATRTLNNPTPSKIRAFVEKLVDERFRDGELDECELTIRDLKNIVDAFLPVLYGVFQHRIEYPDAENKKKAVQKEKARAEKSGNDGNTDSSLKSKAKTK